MFVSLLVTLIIIGVCTSLALYVIDLLPVFEPFNRFAKAVVIIIAIITILERFSAV